MVCINIVHKGLQAKHCKLSELSVNENFSSILIFFSDLQDNAT